MEGKMNKIKWQRGVYLKHESHSLEAMLNLVVKGQNVYHKITENKLDVPLSIYFYGRIGDKCMFIVDKLENKFRLGKFSNIHQMSKLYGEYETLRQCTHQAKVILAEIVTDKINDLKNLTRNLQIQYDK